MKPPASTNSTNMDTAGSLSPSASEAIFARFAKTSGDDRSSTPRAPPPLPLPRPPPPSPALQIARRPHIEPLRLHGESLRRRLCRSELRRVQDRISEHGYPGELRDDFPQDLELLAAQLRQVEEHARDGAARPRQAPDVAH